MEILQRLQPLDILFAILWAALVGWGLSTGLVRQIGMFVGVYGGALLAARRAHDKVAEADFPGVRAYSSTEELVQDDDVDLVVIATPPAHHAELAIAMLRA